LWLACTLEFTALICRGQSEKGKTNLADLNELQSSGMVKLIGSDSSGGEQTPIKSSLNGDLGVADVSDSGGVEGAITVTTTATAVRVGGSNLANRKILTALKNSIGTVFWGYNNTVTTSSGTPFVNNQFMSWAAGPNITIWMIASSGSHNVRVTEAA